MVDFDIFGGEDCIRRSRGYPSSNNQTYIMTSNPITKSGTLHQWCIYIRDHRPNISYKLKIFREQEGTFVFVAESNANIATPGKNVFTIDPPISVKKGDYVGFHHTAGAGSTQVDEGGSAVYQMIGDIVSDHPISSWSNVGNFVFSVHTSGYAAPDANIVSLDYSPSEPKQNDTVRIDYLLDNVGGAGKVAVLLKWLGRNEDGSLNGQEYKIVDEVITMGEGQLQRSAFFTMPDFDVDVMLTTESWDGNDWVNHHKKTVFINKREIKEVVLNDYSLYVCPEEGDCYSPANCTVTLGDCPTAIVKFNVTNPNSFSVDVVASAQVSTPSGFETVQKSATLKANETSDIWLFDVSLSDVGDYTITQTDVSVVI